eukprot:GGOE01005114.1.p1 GENE.GGOE01005114.1~~GGOE01005114.1.p1  ORF type:complete len:236 (-),score=76.06 GGOE01005114.1:655-1362(-)
MTVPERPEEVLPSDGPAVQEGRCSLVGQNLNALPHGLLERALDVHHLDLSGNAFSSVKPIWFFRQLTTLILDNNRIATLEDFPKMPHLTTLWLNNNEIADLNPALDALEGMVPQLQYLSLLGNPACPALMSGATEQEYSRYRVYTIFRLGCTLKFLDAQPVTQQEHALASSSGRFFKVARPANTAPEACWEVWPEALPFEEARRCSQHAIYLCQAHREYRGDQSEGNRFILDSQL